MNVTRNVGRFASGLTVALVALALSAGTALADMELGHTGRVGAHQLNETAENPVVTCHYDEDAATLNSIEVRTPSLWARSESKMHPGAGQRVGWQIIVKRWKDGAAQWKTFFKSGIQKSTAWYNVSAFFPTRTVMPAFNTTVPARYFIVGKFFWYAADGSVAGTALHRYDYYKEQLGSGPLESVAACNERYLF